MIFNAMKESTVFILDKIHAHPFNQELALGTLPLEKFIGYLKQDALYLAEFSRALALTAARLSEDKHTKQFIQFAYEAIQAELDLHSNYINTYQSLIPSIQEEQSPACFNYTNYLLKMASLASVEEAVSSLLPCFFVYYEVGKKISESSYGGNPYSQWITLYASASFESSVQSAINIINELACHASYSLKDKMIAAFRRASQLEWLFWEGAYHQTEWVLE